MKRQLLGTVAGIVVVLSVATPAMAQVSFLTEDFETGTFPPAGWTLASTGATDSSGFQEFSLGVSGSHGDTFSGFFAAWHNDDNTNGTTTDWLVLPQIAVQGGAMTLTFWHRKYQSNYNYHGVWVSTGSGDPADGAFVELQEVVGDDSWAQETIDLSAYQGQTIWLAFRYVGDWSDEWYLDAVVVDATVGPDLSVTKTTTVTGTVHPGDPVPFAIHVENGGPGSVTGLVVTDTLPAGLDFDSCTDGCTYDPTARTVTWTGGLTDGATLDLTLDTVVAADGDGTLTNTVSVSANEDDPDSTNDTASASVTAAPLTADLSIAKTTTVTGTVHPGDPVPFAIHVENGGPDPANNVAVTDTLPAGLDFDSCTGGCSYDAATRTVTWTVPSLASGSNEEWTLNTSVAEGTEGEIVNTVSLTADGTDPDGANNEASASISVALGIPAIPSTTPLGRAALALFLAAAALLVLRRFT